MRSKIEANEYKDFILGFIFYKFLSDAEIKFIKDNNGTEDDIKKLSEKDKDSADFIRKGIGYFIGYENLFSTWIKDGNRFTVGNVTDALSAFERNINKPHEKVFSRIFDVLQTGLGKLGDTVASQSKANRDLIVLINDIPMDKKEDYDILGFVYEYLISQFAANAGKKAGEFYTPHEVSTLMSEIIANHLKDHKEIKIYDPTSGSGSLLINIGKAIEKYGVNNQKISYYAQELKLNTYNLTRMNLVMRGINVSNIFVRNADTLESDWPIFATENDPNTYSLLRVNAVVSNPPYSQPWDPEGKKNDKRYKDFGVAPKSKADYAFLLHDLYHIVDDGIMTIVLPHGVLFRGGEEGEIRKNLIEKNHIDAVIGLPANIFFGIGIPTIIMVLKRKKVNDDILIVDASKHYIKEGKNNKLTASDIKRIIDAIKKRKTIEKFSRVVKRSEIRENDYNLNIPRYVDSSEETESYDIYATMKSGIPKIEVEKFAPYFKSIKDLKETLFKNPEDEYLKTSSENIKETVFNCKGTKSFITKYKNVFTGLRESLIQKLIANYKSVEIGKEEEILGNDIFNRLEKFPLVDKYKAYQILDEDWQKIASDIETMQKEGFACVKQVDANIIIKKKGEVETEVQDGWKGHILPFELVQEELLEDELDAIKRKEESLEQKECEIQEIVEKLSELEDGQAFLNEDNSALDTKELNAKVKTLKNEKVSFAKESIEFLLLQATRLQDEMKKEKKEITKAQSDLHEKTKSKIESLSDKDAKNLLEKKWITPLLDKLENLSSELLTDLAGNLEKLNDKYKDSLNDIEKMIQSAECDIRKMMGELTGEKADMRGIKELVKMLGEQ